MHSTRLRLLFARTLRASLLSPLMLSGCGIIEPGGPCGEPEPYREQCPGVELTGYTLPACNKNWLAMSGLSPALPPDVVQLRLFQPRRLPDEVAHPVVSASGTACATASEPSTCQSALDQLKATQGFHDRCEETCSAFYLATTRGDEVAAHASLQELKNFLGTIDTPQEAVLLAFAQGLDVVCGRLESGAVRANPDGTFNVVGNQGDTCGPGTQLDQVVLKVSPSGDVTEETRTLLRKGNPNCVTGRRPDGLHAAASVDCDSALGRHFAQAAHLEAASIQAFLRLREELAQHGADESLRAAALASALDEVMHTDVSTRLARRFGATPPRLQVEARPPRSLFEVALENIVEGCTRETYGALVAHYQALHARDEEIRGVMARIAEDETRHAELSWAIDRWAHERLSDAERATLREARQRAVETLREELASAPDAQLIDAAGIPPPEVAASMLASLERELWA